MAQSAAVLRRDACTPTTGPECAVGQVHHGPPLEAVSWSGPGGKVERVRDDARHVSSLAQRWSARLLQCSPVRAKETTRERFVTFRATHSALAAPVAAAWRRCTGAWISRVRAVFSCSSFSCSLKSWITLFGRGAERAPRGVIEIARWATVLV